jgi:hypothetical protein
MDRAFVILDLGSGGQVRPRGLEEDLLEGVQGSKIEDRAARRTDGDHGVEVSIRLCESRGMGANPIGPSNPPPTELVNRTVCKTVSAGCNSQGGVQFSCLTHRRRWSITISPYQLLRGVPATVF